MLNDFRKIDIVWSHATNRIYKKLRVASSDDKGRKLAVQVVDNNTVQDTSEVELRLYWQHGKSDGFNDFELVDAENGIYEIYFSRGMLKHIGLHKAWLHATDTTGSVTSEVFGVEVFPGVDLEAVESTDEFSALNSALARVVAIESQEEERKQAESDRVSAEKDRENSENKRASTFENNEADRRETFIDNEEQRQWDFESSQENRRTTFDQSQSDQQTDYEAAEEYRDELYEEAEETREQDYSQRAEELEGTYAPRLTEVEGKTAPYEVEGDTLNFKETPTVNGKPLLWFGTIEEI